MIREDARVLLEQAGNLVSQVEIIDATNGCRFKVKLKQGSVRISMFLWGKSRQSDTLDVVNRAHLISIHELPGLHHD